MVSFMPLFGGKKLSRKPSFSPDDLSDLALWLDASDAGTITSSGGLVSQWDDKSTNSNNATQTNASLQPTTGENTINGKNVISTDATNRMELTSAVSRTNGYTVFFVGAAVDTTSTKTFIGGAGGGLSLRFNSSESAAIARNQQATILTGSPAVGTSNNIICFKTSSAGNQIINNGTSIGSNTTDPAYSADFNAILVDIDTSARFYGNVAEIIVYTRILDTTEINQVGNYLDSKWGITWTDYS